LAITVATTDWLASPPLLGEADGVGSRGGEPCSSAEGWPKLQAEVAATVTAASTAAARRRVRDPPRRGWG
jgi:hypothetical protein